MPDLPIADAPVYIRELTPYLLDVSLFQQKMGHAYDGPQRLPGPDLALFRLRFLGEELRELGKAVGVVVDVTCTSTVDASTWTGETRVRALTETLDALVDLDYVLLGTVLQLGLGPVYEEAWRRVQAANLLKVAGVKSTRGFTKDAVKPVAWLPPDHTDLVEGDA